MMYSLEADLVLDLVDACIKQSVRLLQGVLLLQELLMLLLEECHLILIAVLEFPEIPFEVCDILEDALEEVVQVLGHLVLQARTLTPKELPLALVLIQVVGQLHGIVFYGRHTILDGLLAGVENSTATGGVNLGLVHLLFYLI